MISGGSFHRAHGNFTARNGLQGAPVAPICCFGGKIEQFRGAQRQCRSGISWMSYNFRGFENLKSVRLNG
jgi:hypothetical protein